MPRVMSIRCSLAVHHDGLPRVYRRDREASGATIGITSAIKSGRKVRGENGRVKARLRATPASPASC